MPRLALYLKVYFVRFVQSVLSFLDRYASTPLPPRHSFTVTIPSVQDKRSRTIKLYFYMPPGYRNKDIKSGNYPCVVNFHGGGYTIGAAIDDARWASYVTQKLDVVFVSVEYGLAPENPYPIGIGDGVDAVQYLWKNAERYSIDNARTIFTGFSAGGTLSITVALRVYEMRKHDSVETAPGKIVGIAAFYPGLNWTQSRSQRTASNPISGPKGAIPASLFEIFDNSYLGPESLRPDMSSQYVSPGIADSNYLKAALPRHLVIYSCEWDQLLVENETFRDRLKSLGKIAGGYMVEGEPHAWDKKPKLWKEDKRRNEMYNDAIAKMRDTL